MFANCRKIRKSAGWLWGCHHLHRVISGATNLCLQPAIHHQVCPVCSFKSSWLNVTTCHHITEKMHHVPGRHALQPEVCVHFVPAHCTDTYPEQLASLLRKRYLCVILCRHSIHIPRDTWLSSCRSTGNLLDGFNCKIIKQLLLSPIFRIVLVFSHFWDG